ncbi:unnamed protein product [Merluccius merluccius]
MLVPGFGPLLQVLSTLCLSASSRVLFPGASLPFPSPSVLLLCPRSPRSQSSSSLVWLRPSSHQVILLCDPARGPVLVPFLPSGLADKTDPQIIIFRSGSTGLVGLRSDPRRCCHPPGSLSLQRQLPGRRPVLCRPSAVPPGRPPDLLRPLAGGLFDVQDSPRPSA